MTADAWMDSDAGHPVDGSRFDVLIVGCGPTGRVLALLLARSGWRVGVVERRSEPYDMPRAVVFDDESARILATAGIGSALPDLSHPATTYEWRNAGGETLLRFDWSGLTAEGWPRANFFHQPHLERALGERMRACPRVAVFRAVEAVAVHQDGLGVELSVAPSGGREVGAAPARPPARLRARYLVGCDGAHSMVRAVIDPPMTDLGFHYDWLIIDVALGDPREQTALNLQVCDPARPTTAVSGGTGRRRWEFMRLPGEDVAELCREETAWRLLRPWGVTPETARLERHTLYTFQACWAERWRDRRVLIAGDAAHLMPPFAGAGMCSGLRDAANLAWKLDLVLRDRAADGLLDTYETERVPQIRYTVEVSAALGSIVCVSDQDEAADRDAGLLRARAAGESFAEPPPPPLGPGVVRAGPTGAPEPPAGTSAPQWRVACGDRVGLLDDITGYRFAVLTVREPPAELTGHQLVQLERIGACLVHVVPGTRAEAATAPGPGGDRSTDRTVLTVADADRGYIPYLRAHGTAMILRPDRHIFGTADGPGGLGGLGGLVDDLLVRLGTAAVTPP